MKLLASGDWHYTSTTPDSRIDNYQETLHNKIEQIFALALEEDVDLFLQAGDMTDSPFLSYNTFIILSNLLKKYKPSIHSIYGQHDLRYRNKGNTPLDALIDRGLVYLLDSNPYSPIRFPEVAVYGCSFGEKHPEIQDSSKFNILVLHQLILATQERDWQKEQVLHSALLKTTKYDLIVSGDNHKGFVLKSESKPYRYIVNCGSLMRSSIDQVDHKPFVVIFDTDKRTAKKVFLKIKPWEEVFDLERKVKQEERDENLEIYAEGLKEQKDMGLDYVANLMAAMQENNTKQAIHDLAIECVTE